MIVLFVVILVIVIYIAMTLSSVVDLEALNKRELEELEKELKHSDGRPKRDDLESAKNVRG